MLGRLGALSALSHSSCNCDNVSRSYVGDAQQGYIVQAAVSRDGGTVVALPSYTEGGSVSRTHAHIHMRLR